MTIFEIGQVLGWSCKGLYMLISAFMSLVKLCFYMFIYLYFYV